MQWDDEVRKAQEENSMLLECYRNRIQVRSLYYSCTFLGQQIADLTKLYSVNCDGFHNTFFYTHLLTDISILQIGTRIKSGSYHFHHNNLL